MTSTYSKLEYGSGTSKEGGITAEREGDELGVARRNHDFCMVFKYKTSKSLKFEEQDNDYMVNRTLAEPSEVAMNKMNLWKQRRETILKGLTSVGLHVFCYYSRDRDEIIVKVGASAKKLRSAAARMKYKLQLKKQFLDAYAEYREDFPGRPECQYKDRRVISHIYKTHTEDDFTDSDAIFKTIDKISLIHNIITSKDKDCAGVPVGNLLYQDELMGYFPLHDNQALAELSKPSKLQWFVMDEDHANKMRDYFGGKIAFYFLFLGFYWKWLVPLAVVGLILTFVDLCTHTPDNMTAIFFCILMSIWSTYMPYFWRRQEAKYALSWGTLDLQTTLEPCRPQYFGEPRINPVTTEVEPYYPWEQRIWHYMFSAATLLVSAMMLVCSLLLIMLFRHRMRGDLPGGILLFQLFVAIFVEVMNALLTKMARWLTQLENHRTQSEYDQHMLNKVMVWKFVNSFFVLYYIAFFKKHKYLFGEEMNCLHGDCFVDLQAQLAIFVFFRLTLSNLVEHLYPKFALWYRSCYNDQSFLTTFFHGNQRLELADLSKAEQESKRMPYDKGADFSEILITHGYSTLFAVTAPWVCAANLVGVLLEIYVDMTSLVENRQRPVPVRARDNEPWTTAFDIYGVLSASTNIVLLIFASNQYESWTFTEKLTLFVYLEHVIFLLRFMLRLIFPEVPRSVELLHAKQEMMVHRALENIKVEQDQDFSMFRDRTASSQFEVFEHDYLEDPNEVEPTLELGESMKTMVRGVQETYKPVP